MAGEAAARHPRADANLILTRKCRSRRTRRAVADEAAAESMQLEEEDILSRAINAILPFTRGVQSDIQRQAVYALANMAASGKYRAAAMEAGAVPILVDLLAAQDDSIRLQVMSMSMNRSTGSRGHGIGLHVLGAPMNRRFGAHCRGI